MRRARPVLSLLLTVVVAAGCGGGGGGGGNAPESKDQYTKDLQQASQTLQKELSNIGSVGAGASDSEAASKLDQGSKALDQAADKLSGIKPPNDVKDAHNKLVAALKDLGGQLHKIADAARKGDRQALLQSLQSLTNSDAVKKFEQAASELNAKGITVPQ
jgi:uncharacterized protein YukE